MVKITQILIGIVCFLCAANAATAQNVYLTKNASVRFFSGATLEDIEAVSKDVKAAIDFDKKSYSIRIGVKTFKFKSELMEEHFNENYMESEKYPNASFKGNLTGNFDLKTDGQYNIEAVGTMEIHGVTKEYKIPLKLIVKGAEVKAEGVFKVKLEDHKVDIPKVMFQKIAEEVEVTIKLDLKHQ